MYKIPEDRVGQSPDKRSPEYKVAHVQYYDYLVSEKFPCWPEQRMRKQMAEAVQAQALKLSIKAIVTVKVTS